MQQSRVLARVNAYRLGLEHVAVDGLDVIGILQLVDQPRRRQHERVGNHEPHAFLAFGIGNLNHRPADFEHILRAQFCVRQPVDNAELGVDRIAVEVDPVVVNNRAAAVGNDVAVLVNAVFVFAEAVLNASGFFNLRRNRLVFDFHAAFFLNRRDIVYFLNRGFGRRSRFRLPTVLDTFGLALAPSPDVRFADNAGFGADFAALRLLTLL